MMISCDRFYSNPTLVVNAGQHVSSDRKQEECSGSSSASSIAYSLTYALLTQGTNFRLSPSPVDPATINNLSSKLLLLLLKKQLIIKCVGWMNWYYRD